jgi:hypothetical protein
MHGERVLSMGAFMQMGHEVMFNQSGIDVVTGLKSKVRLPLMPFAALRVCLKADAWKLTRRVGMPPVLERNLICLYIHPPHI